MYIHTKNPKLNTFLVGLGMENVGVLYGHLEYFMAIW
jgi:hypothetical protein